MMFRVAVRLLGQRAEAEDVLQEAWMSVFEKIGTFQEHAALTTWLYRIVVNAALMRVRQRGLAAETLLDPPGPPLTEGGYHARTVADWTASPEDALLRQEALTLLRQAVDRLPSGYRAVYVLAEIEGLPHQEIAHLLEVSVGAVTVRLHRARLGLREALSEYFEGRQQWPAGTPGAEETIS
jgi:RNA polymerase sigma-70 factor (ECF subfamily)